MAVTNYAGGETKDPPTITLLKAISSELTPQIGWSAVIYWGNTDVIG